MSARYAVYALPGALSPHPVRALAEAWLGRTVDGRFVAPAVPRGWTRAEVDAITVDARRYGAHVTLKAPFRLADGVRTADLDTRVSDFARRTAPVTMPSVELRRLGSFFALVPGAPAPRLHALADAVVRTFDDLRAPLTDAERSRRRPERLIARQRELLDTWGYPYVLDELRAHLTLTDQVPPRDRPRVEAALEGHFARYFAGHFTGFPDRDVLVDALCVYVEPEAGAPFVLRSVHRLEGARPAAVPAPVIPTQAVLTHAVPTQPVAATSAAFGTQP